MLYFILWVDFFKIMFVDQTTLVGSYAIVSFALCNLLITQYVEDYFSLITEMTMTVGFCSFS